MAVSWRRLTQSVAPAIQQLALDHCLYERMSRGEGQPSLRFYRFAAPAVTIGAHQILEQEVRLDYCQQRDIHIARRESGGGALYVAPDQIHFSLVARRDHLPPGDYLNLICTIGETIATSLRKIGVNANFRSRNDIEVGGKKVGSVTGVVSRGAVLLQGSLLLSIDVGAMLWALKVPMEKLTPEGLDAARDRVMGLRECMPEPLDTSLIEQTLQSSIASLLDAEFVSASLSDDETAAWTARSVVDTNIDWIDREQSPQGDNPVLSTVLKRDGGIVRVMAAVDIAQSRLADIAISGDFNVQPPHAINELARELRGADFPEVKRRMEDFFATRAIDLGGLSPSDFVLAVRQAIEKIEYNGMDIGLNEANAMYPINVPEGRSLQEVISEASVFLLPYCAKLPECKYRFTQGCSECGMCTIGDAYRLARERNMEAVTIIRFEHLKATLADMKARGVKSYIGACCEEFYVKRQQAFLDAGVPGVLLDIDGKTCYQMRQEDQAYAGTFQALADLKAGLVNKVLSQIPIKTEEVQNA